MDFLSLPVVMVENIISYLTYDEIAKCRMVSKYFDEICKRMLNRGFVKIERRHNFALKSVKAQLPRRESERRYHPLSRHCDILTSIETRISMLNMTYSKYIDNNMCCFIPGKVIDEIQRVLTVVENSKTPPRAHEVLQELRDISSMAIEHFDDKISPAFRKKLRECVAPPPPRPANNVLAPFVMRQEMMNLRKRSSLNTKMTIHLFEQYKGFYVKMLKYKKLAWNQRKFLRQMHRRLHRQDTCIAELKRRIEECDIKYNELTHKNQAVDVKVQATSAGDMASPSTQSLRNFGSQIKLDLSVLPIGTSKRNQSKLPNIKPRKPQIRLPSLSDYDSNGEATAPNSPQPSTSSERFTPRPTAQTQSTLAKIRGLAKEIRQLSNMTLIKSKAINVDMNKGLDRLKKMEKEKFASKRKQQTATESEDLHGNKKPKVD